MWPLGKFLIVLGLCVAAIGLLLTLAPKLPFPLGRLPGDILVKRENFIFSFPVATCLILSFLLTLLLNLLFRR